MAHLPSKRLRTKSPSQCQSFDPEKCIICQEVNPQYDIKSSKNGRKRLVEAAQIRKDKVFERLKHIDPNDIVYHVNNNCYKDYTHKGKLEKILQKTKSGNLAAYDIGSSSQQQACLTDLRRRSMVKPRDLSKHKMDINIFKKNCVICGKAKYKNVYEKYPISDKSRAESFLKATSVLLDDVFTRTCDLQSATAVLAANLNCHKICIRNYIRKGERLSSIPKPLSEDEQRTEEPLITKSDDCNYDEIKRCGAQLRETILKQDFLLNDRFCDASELQRAYDDIVIPDDVTNFFSSLFNLDNKCFNTVSEGQTEQTNYQSGMKTRVLALYQIIFYILNNGRKRTPLHMMNSEAIYNACRSKTLISSFNRFGLSISYDELLRFHSDMASFVVETSRNQIPLPSHFQPCKFTIAALDNFDHEEATLSGIGGSHDTVMILMQDKSTETSNSKPNISDTGVTHRERRFKQQLICQTLRNYTRPVKKPCLSLQYEVSKEPFHLNDKEETMIRSKDISWVLARMNLFNLDEDACNAKNSEEQLTPSWSAFNSLITDEEIAPKIIGFLPVLPFPVTDYATVYTALKNFQDVLSQLNQTHLPVFCDEGVYHIGREIIMNNPMEFSNLVLCLGSFHMIKVVMGAIGKYIDGSGAETIMTESRAFGKNVVRSVLDGTHYTRSLKGLTMLSECIERLQWSEFFQVRGHHQYENELAILQKMKEAVSKKKREEAKLHLESFISTSSCMIEDFNTFISERIEVSETFLYWHNFVKMVHVLKDLVRADREGNWQLHLHSVQAALPLFAGCDRINYFRWASIYLEDMRKLPLDAPTVYENFNAGQFVVKRLNGSFNSVGADMCLEQTINRSQKSAGGIIGCTKRKQFVTQWEIIYHEMLAVVNLHREVSGVVTHSAELLVNHEFSLPATITSEALIQDMISYIKEHGNPVTLPEYRDKDKQLILHNIVTQEVMSNDIRDNLLNFDKNSLRKYETFRSERIVTKQKSIFDTIHRTNLKTFKSIKLQKSKNQANNKHSKMRMAELQKIFDIARVRGLDIEYLLAYDLVECNYLFDEDGLMKKSNKSDLCSELERHLSKTDYHQPTKWKPENTTSILDVMCYLRRMCLTKVKTFGELCCQFLDNIYKLCSGSNRIDFVFDSYMNGSVKDSERIRRCNCSPVDLNEVNTETRLPVTMDRFWASISNKVKLQMLLRNYILKNPKPMTDIVVSTLGATNETQQCNGIFSVSNTSAPVMDVNLEEADVKIIPHALHAVCSGATRVVILSSDTDVMVLALHYWDHLQNHGLKELWIRAGVGNTTRYIPLHALAIKLGTDICKVLVAVHHLTGCDSTSKFGTKAAGLKANPYLYLHNFGKYKNDIEFALIEEYLVNVYKPGTPCKTMDELRYHLFHHSKKTLLDLPPTSRAIQGHILRAFYGTYLQLHCLETVHLDPKTYGYNLIDDILQPQHDQILLPEDFPMPCKCVSCATKRCPCRQLQLECCQYCNCQASDKNCSNPAGKAETS